MRNTVNREFESSGKRSTLAPDIVQGSLVALQQRCELLQAFRVEGVDEADVSRAQQVHLDQITTVGRNGQVLPHVKARVLRVRYAHDHVLDANAKLALFVVAGLVGGAHALFELEGNTSANVIGTFVTVEVAADAMACTVHIV